MNLEQIKALFPLKGQVTQEIIDKAHIHNPAKCIGALTLRAALPSLDDIRWVSWGNIIGGLRIGEKLPVDITTEGHIEMMHVKEPREVTFVLVNHLNPHLNPLEFLQMNIN